MKDDSDVEIHDDSTDDKVYSDKRRRMDSDSNKFLPALLIILFVLIIAGGIYYFFTKRPPEGDGLFQSKVGSLEEKITFLEKQIGNLQAKSGAGGPDPVLVHQIEALSERVAALEKRTGPSTESKRKSSPSEETVSSQKRYHTVQKGETLSRISKKYGISVEELRKLNDLSKGQSPKPGQKLLVSGKS